MVITVAQLMPTVQIRSVHMSASVLMDSLVMDSIVQVRFKCSQIYQTHLNAISKHIAIKMLIFWFDVKITTQLVVIYTVDFRRLFQEQE